MKKKDYSTKLARVEKHYAAKQYEKALAEFLELNKSDKPLAVKLGIPDRIEKLHGLIKDQKFSLIRGLGIIIVEAFNKKNQYQEIYRVPITKKVDEDGNDIHPLRLPAILRTRFERAPSEEWLDEQVEIFQNTENENNSEFIEKIEERDKTIEALAEDLKAAKKEIVDLKKPAPKKEADEKL